jgi:hypothetical protein
MADPPLLPMAFVPAPNRYSETETDNDRLTSSLRLYGAVHALLGCAVGEAGGIAFAASVGLNAVARVACGAIVGLVLSQSFGLAFFRRHRWGAGEALAASLGIGRVAVPLMILITSAVLLAVPGAAGAGPQDPLLWQSLLLATSLGFTLGFALEGWSADRGSGRAGKPGGASADRPSVERRLPPEVVMASREHALTAVRYEGEVIGFVNPEQAWLDPEIAALEDDHPHKRFVSMLCLVGHEMQSGEGAEPYSHELAATYTREILVPEEEFVEAAYLPDVVLAERFNVPLEQVRLRRSELRQRRADADHLGEDADTRAGD